MSAQLRSDLDEIKSRVTIPEAWRLLGLPGEPRRSCRSPFRQDKSPSFSIFADDRRFKDFATGEGGDVIDFVQAATGCTPRDAICRVRDWAGGAISAPPPTARKRPAMASAAPFDRLTGLTLEEPSFQDVVRIAQVRDWPLFAGIEIARLRGLLVTATVPHLGESHRAWLLTDQARKSAQARRLDGETWSRADGDGFKSKSLRSDAEAPIGLADVIDQDRRLVLLAEGEPDALAALLIAWASPVPMEKIGVLCIPGAGRPIRRAAAERLLGRHVRILRHADEAGLRAAVNWSEDLESFGVLVDSVDLRALSRPDGAATKDFADLIRRPLELEELESLAAQITEGFAR